jgi:NADH:ubiquinone oxidoreductase subunit B-like Fe-S oxidoreductase
VLSEGACPLSAGGTYGDPVGRGYETFTGAEQFVPIEIEV